MFYTITGEFINNKKNIIEKFSDEEKVHIKFKYELKGPNDEVRVFERLLVPRKDSDGKVDLIFADPNLTFADDLRFTVKSRSYDGDNIKYLSTKNVSNSENTDYTTLDNDQEYVFCFVPKKNIDGNSQYIINVVLVSETSSSDTISIDELIEESGFVLNKAEDMNESDIENYRVQSGGLENSTVVVNNLTSTFLEKFKNILTKAYENDSVRINAVYDMMVSSILTHISFVNEEGVIKKTLDDPEVICPPGYKCIPSDSWSTLLSNVDNLDSNLDNMNILDGDINN